MPLACLYAGRVIWSGSGGANESDHAHGGGKAQPGVTARRGCSQSWDHDQLSDQKVLQIWEEHIGG